MEDGSSPTTITNGAIGARLKAGLQSRFLSKPASIMTSPQKSVGVNSCDVAEDKDNCTVQGKVQQAAAASESSCVNDELLGDVESSDADNLNDCDETLLDAENSVEYPLASGSAVSNGEPASKKQKLDNADSVNEKELLVEKTDTVCDESANTHVDLSNESTVVTPLNEVNNTVENGTKVGDIEDESSKPSCIVDTSVKDTSCVTNPDVTCAAPSVPQSDDDNSVVHVNEPTSDSCKENLPVHMKGHSPSITGLNDCVEATKQEDMKVTSPASKKESDNAISPHTEISSNNIDNQTKQEKTSGASVNQDSIISSSENKATPHDDETANTEPLVELVDDSESMTEPCRPTISHGSVTAEKVSQGLPTSVPASKTTTMERTTDSANIKQVAPNTVIVILSPPEKVRSAEHNSPITPPVIHTSTDTLLSCTPPADEDMMVDEPSTASRETGAVIKHTMDELLCKTVAAVDCEPVTNVHTQRASPHVSPSNSDDENGELVLGAASAEEYSEDDDSRDVQTCTEDSNSTAAPSSGRLNKLISHLSSAYGEASTSSQPEPMEQEDTEAFDLKKNGLASFYDKIIKKTVLCDTYHKELSRKHQELQIKNNMDIKKITKILQEVKAVREKLKVMNVRPAQRSVSTQIFSEKLDVGPVQAPGVKILKSRVKSQKALIEHHRQQAAELQKKQLATNKSQVICGEAELKAERQQQEAAMMHMKRATAMLQTQANKPVPLTPAMPVTSVSAQLFKQVTMIPPRPIAPRSQLTPPKAAAPSDSEVIDLTAEEDTKTEGQNHTAGVYNGVSPFKAAIHPAPLPQCPLTGKPGHLLKPPSPNLELNSKEDGIILQWNMILTKSHAKISTYQIFGYKERTGPLLGNEWKKVGDLKALPLPMACTLTQFQTGHTYHFAVRAVDDLGRTGPFGAPKSTKLG